MYLILGLIILVLGIMIVGIIPALALAAGGALTYANWGNKESGRGSPFFRQNANGGAY